MGDERKTGLQAAVAETVAESDAAPGAATDQLPLWPAAELDQRPAYSQVEPRGRGRPPGARNKSTDDWVEWIRSRYRSPLEMLAETMSRPAAVLAEELGTTRLEAFKLQIQAAKELAPYLHSKMPQALQINSAGHMTLIIEGLNGVRQDVAGDGAVVFDAEFESVENQGVSDAAAEKSEDGQSEDEA